MAALSIEQIKRRLRRGPVCYIRVDWLRNTSRDLQWCVKVFAGCDEIECHASTELAAWRAAYRAWQKQGSAGKTKSVGQYIVSSLRDINERLDRGDTIKATRVRRVGGKYVSEKVDLKQRSKPERKGGA